MKIIFKKYTPFWILLGSLIMTVVMILAKPAVQSTEKKFIPPLVETQPVIMKDIRVKVESQGTVTPRTEIRLMPEISGKIDWVSDNLQSGATFHKGDVLLRLNKRDYELALIAAESNLSQAKVNYEREMAESLLAAREWERINGGEASDLTLRKPQLAQAKALLAAMEAGYEQAERNLFRTDIISPFNGRIRKKNVDVGMVVGPSIALAQVYATDIVEISLPIAEKDLAFLNIPLDGRNIPTNEQPSVLLHTLYAGKQAFWEGKIIRSAAEIDSRTRMLSVIAQVSNPYTHNLPLKVGMFVKAEIEGKQFLQIAVVPRYTVRDNKIWVVNEEGVLFQKDVEVLRYEHNSAFIRSGLSSEDAILLTRLAVLVEGMKLNQKKDSN